MTPSIERPDVSAAAVVTALTGELLEEIQTAIGERVFSFDAALNQTRLEEALETGRCVVFLARGRGPARRWRSAGAGNSAAPCRPSPARLAFTNGRASLSAAGGSFAA
ncbi:MAG: hypothetical protein ACKO50_06965 [Cyanobium sp.]